MADFGDIRSMLHGPATDDERIDAWEELLAALTAEHSARPEEVEEQWFPYVLATLDAQWPDEARMAPRAWVNQLIRGEDAPVLMPLVRAIDVRRMNNPRMQKLFRSAGFEWVRHLTFGGFNFKLATVKVLAKSRSFSRLNSLTFFDTKLGLQKIYALSKAPFADRLVRLRMFQCELGDQDIVKLLEKNDMSQLRVLDLAQYREVRGDGSRDRSWFDHTSHYGATAAEALAEAELPALRDLDVSGWRDVSVARRVLAAPWVGQLERLRISMHRDVAYWDGEEAAQKRRRELSERLHASALAPEVLADTIEDLEARGQYAPPS